MKTLFFVIGTRPEALKLFSLIKEAQKYPQFQTVVCATNQQTDLLSSCLKHLNIRPDISFQREGYGYSLGDTSAWLVLQFEKIFKKNKPDLVIVQGDTTSAFSGALSAYYSKIRIAHVEAGLRTGDLLSPWPEEGYRKMIDQLASYYFVPTKRGKSALTQEGVSENKIWVVGNSSIDALILYQQTHKRPMCSQKRSIVVTMHRKENHGTPLIEMCQALKTLSGIFPDIEISFFMHSHPTVQETALKLLGETKNIRLQAPSDYFTFIELMMKASFILTDSGGIQEEAPYLGTPVLITRKTTERPEGIVAQTARLIGTSYQAILSHCAELLENPLILRSMSKIHYPYGKGDSGKQIIQILKEVL